MLTVAAQLRYRLEGDFFMRSRLRAYEQLLEGALRAGYRVSSVGGLWQQIGVDGLASSERILVLRHDIDTDPRTAAVMWKIDRGLGVESSYFFRLSTIAPRLMADIAASGSEASYHYEEFSMVAKRRHLRRPADALAHLPEARALFAENLARLRVVTGLPMRVVASHGDFVNRRLGIPNWVVLADSDLRRRLDIELETYDEAFQCHLSSRHTDAPPPRRWEPTDPMAAIRAGQPIVSILVHPRHWRVDWIVNVRDDVRRVVEGVRFDLPVCPRSRA